MTLLSYSNPRFIGLFALIRQAARKMGVSDRWVRKLLLRMKTGSGSGEAGREGMSQRSQSRWQERLDGTLLRSAGTSTMASGTDCQPEKLSANIGRWSQ
jgi:hypothetical protein